MRIKGLVFSYDGFTLSIDDLEVPDEAVTALIGPNGSGKTTLLKLIAGILRPRRGSVLFKGIDLLRLPPRARARIVSLTVGSPPRGFTTTVREAVLMGRYPHQRGLWPSRDDYEVVDRILEDLGLRELADRRLDELSNGELQRAIIARALAQEPKLLLLDEPAAHLDLRYRLEVLGLLRRLADEHHITVLMALHDVTLALRFSDHVVVLKEGRVYASGRPRAVVTRDMLREVYGVEAELVETPQGLLVNPLGPARG